MRLISPGTGMITGSILKSVMACVLILVIECPNCVVEKTV